MGQSGADFGAVSTEGLILRVRRKADTVKASIETHPLLRRKGKDRRKETIDATLTEIDAAWVEVKAGMGSERQFREALIALLDPRLSGGDRPIRFRF